MPPGAKCPFCNTTGFRGFKGLQAHLDKTSCGSFYDAHSQIHREEGQENPAYPNVPPPPSPPADSAADFASDDNETFCIEQLPPLLHPNQMVAESTPDSTSQAASDQDDLLSVNAVFPGDVQLDTDKHYHFESQWIPDPEDEEEDSSSSPVAPSQPTNHTADPWESELEDEDEDGTDEPYVGGVPPESWRPFQPNSNGTTQSSTSASDESSNNSCDDPRGEFMKGACRYDVTDEQFLHSHTVQDACLLELIDILDNAAAPLYLFKTVTKWAVRAAERGLFNDVTQIPSRKSFLEHLQKRFDPDGKLGARPVTVQLETEHNQRGARGRRTATVITWDFQSVLQDLFNDHTIFGNLENLVVDPQFPFAPYNRATPGETMYEANTGNWYHNAVVELDMYGGDKRRMLVPIVLTMDKTGVTKNQKHGAEPLMVSTSLLTRKAREHHRAWRHLALMPDLEFSSQARRQLRNKGQSKCPIDNVSCDGVLRIVLPQSFTIQFTPHTRTTLRRLAMQGTITDVLKKPFVPSKTSRKSPPRP